jgi:hypothetical protein
MWISSPLLLLLKHRDATAIQAAVNRSEMAVATGARNFIRMLGGSVALAASSALLNNAVK